ncbi:MAG: tRNA uridine-5-carboxymethylaminomethyl(34) synthesis GTPase MnmE [Ignavibacteriae bacterium]|nr:tRNA uridine-5-carboxymethylaminomethyl(34) synthesis GTPase MnmE [Ignavibacteriota bacterium]
MLRAYRDDTIAAIATPVGEGAIGMVRVSGADSIAVIGRAFRGGKNLSDVPSHTVHHGWIVDVGGREIDEVLAAVFRSPHSYTGEDSVEVSCHGGMYVTQQVLSAILSAGARQAEPGEFTKRAFLNGKLDLSQAEAVADLIAAKSESAYRISVNQLEGKFSDQIKLLRKEILDLTSSLELELDFSEEGIELVSRSDLIRSLDKALERITQMADSYRFGRLSREGAMVAIVGKPNVGKSSLFNALLRESRAIVTEIPGTTRDSLEETLAINGVHFRLNDTAGLRESADQVEREGIERTMKLLANADLVLMVIDAAADGLNVGDDIRNQIKNDGGKFIVVFNKVDLLVDISRAYRESGFEHVLVSAKSGLGLKELREKIWLAGLGSPYAEQSITVTNERHHGLLLKAGAALARARELVNQGLTSEFIGLETRCASESLGEIIGEVSSEDTLNNIFLKFCIGK